ncbi:MAG: phosphoribosyltransferase, partial [Clostridia bacterium]|nr:phosphoribosyltransferase [Clostridia bacterium]
MGVILLQPTEKLSEIIGICKSSSGVCGKRLRDAHMTAGRLLGERIAADGRALNYAVVIAMRAGLPFGLGIADALEEDGNVRIFFSTKEKPVPENLNVDSFGKIIIADAVIRTGNDMISLADKFSAPDKIIYATNVIDASGIPNFEGKTVYAVRSSQNSFVGSEQKFVGGGKGPD